MKGVRFEERAKNIRYAFTSLTADSLNDEVISVSHWTCACNRGPSLFCLSRQNEEMDEKSPRDTQSPTKGHGFCGHVYRIGHGLSVQMIKSFDFKFDFV